MSTPKAKDIIKDMTAVINNAKATPKDVELATKIVNGAVSGKPGAGLKPSLKLVDVKLKPVEKAADKPDAAVKGPSPVFKQEHRYGRKVTTKVALSQVGEEIVSIEDFDRMTTGVVVMGRLLQPVETREANNLRGGFSSGFRRMDHEDDLDDPFLINTYQHTRGADFLNVNGEDKTPFNVYRFTLNNRATTVLMDETSKLWLGENQGDGVEWDLRDEHINRDGPVIIIMKNSIAVDCHFYDQVTLVGVIAKESTFQSSAVANYEQPPVMMNRLPWSSRRRYHYSFKKEQRTQITGTTLTNMVIDNSDIPAGGSYYNGNIRDSIIECPGQVTFRDASVYESTVKAVNRLFLGKVTMKACSIEAKGEIRLHMPSLTDMWLRADSIYARNKFAITKIEVPNPAHTDDYTLIRTSSQEMILQLGRNGEFTIKLGAEPWSLAHELREWLRKNDLPEENEAKGTPDAPYSPITESVHTYVIDTVISRIKVINMLDDTVETARNLESKDMSRYFHRYF
jgi:hypothetical protein